MCDITVLLAKIPISRYQNCLSVFSLFHFSIPPKFVAFEMFPMTEISITCAVFVF